MPRLRGHDARGCYGHVRMFERSVIGVDPGLSRCGVAVVRGSAHRPSMVESDVVRTPSDQPVGQRLQSIHRAIQQLVATHRPSSLAVERVFINAQARTGVGAIQVVGLVHLIGADAQIAVTEYTPSQVKAAVTGVGDADKDQVMFMVQRLLTLDRVPSPADRADAMAVALCHLGQPGHRTQGPVSPAAAQNSASGLPPRLAAAAAQAGPGLSPVRREGQPT